MDQIPPALIAIDRDDYYASHVGRSADGRQFFVTTPFVSATAGDAGRELIAVYLFDPQGGFLEARIDDLGPRRQLDQDRARKLLERRLAELGHVVYQRIQVRPFEVERFGTTFGLIPRPPESVESQRAGWWVEVRPGNYMAFHEPWDSGEYDT